MKTEFTLILKETKMKSTSQKNGDNLNLSLKQLEGVSRVCFFNRDFIFCHFGLSHKHTTYQAIFKQFTLSFIEARSKGRNRCKTNHSKISPRFV
jgi:hypothetical protein